MEGAFPRLSHAVHICLNSQADQGFVGASPAGDLLVNVTEFANVSLITRTMNLVHASHFPHLY